MGRYVMDIPGWRPTLDNRLRGNVFAAHARKKNDFLKVANAGLALRVPPATGPRRVSVTIAVPRGKFPDPLAPYKSLLDALKRNGLLVDDDGKHCLPEPAVYVRGPKATTIVLEDLPIPPERG